jgi:single-strand DNA-binding protein
MVKQKKKAGGQLMNKIILNGRATAEPALKYLPSGKAVCNFTLAVRRDFKNQSGEYESDFFNCVAYGKTGELIADYVKKGALFPIWGRVQIRNYTDKEGNKRYVTEIIVEGFDFPPKDNQTNSTNSTNYGHEVDDDEIPF